MEDREKGERDSPQWALATGKCRPGNTSGIPRPGPTPLCPGLPGGCAPRYQVLGGSATQWRMEAEARSVQPDAGAPLVPGLIPTRGREAKTRGKPQSDSLFGF